MQSSDFNKVAQKISLLTGCSIVNLMQIFKTPFQRETSGGLLMIKVLFPPELYDAAQFLKRRHKSMALG